MRPTVLIVEDDAFILEMLLDAIEVIGCHAIGVGRASQVESVASETAPDLLVIDVMLPEMNGLELGQHLRATGYSMTPMIAMSASKRLAEEARESGLFDTVLDKPIDVPTLLSCVEGHLEIQIQAGMAG